MVRARFPGKPSKHFNRRKVSSFLTSRGYEGSRAAEDTFCRLSVFNLLFSEEDEGSSFHGFSPHESPQPVEDHSVSRKPKRKPTEVTKPQRKESDPEMPPERKEATVSGKFVLPTRSAHSSRVIKPNKRFLEMDTTDVPQRKQARTEPPPEAEKPTEDDGSASFMKKPAASQSPVKFVLRKPRLKIKSQPFPMVEGPFSSSSAAVQKTPKEQKHVSTKVVCGVCGTLRGYRFIKQARKFGIFSCDSCRRFILKMVRLEREKSMEPLTCASGTGNCPIIHSTLVSSTFSSIEETQKKSPNRTSDRCQACWLNLCLRSFRLPQDLSKRLSSYLPSEIAPKPVPVFDKPEANREENEQLSPCESKEVTELKKPKRRRVEDYRKSKAKPKLPVTGPRVKHVCRSASLVLGQPLATFAGTPPKACPPAESIKKVDTKPVSALSLHSNDKPKKTEEPFSDNPKDKFSDKSIARTLQDLGRDNCELLDGLERHELQKKFAKVTIDFWESYDPEEVSMNGFPLIGYNPLRVRALCFLCGSAGFEKMVHCASCCEPYHTFCVSSLRFENQDDLLWKLDWICPRCTHCEICSKPGNVQVSCSSCFKSYHTSCVPSGRANVTDSSWVCPSCLYCKSCHGSSVHVFVGNMPLCRVCFKLRKKGNFCPLCQRCYDDNDFDTKMMECADCKRWIHAKCEQISDETYQVLSYLPSSVEFVCRKCCSSPPPLWALAVSQQLKEGYLNVIKALSKNRQLCTIVKASPKKRVCVCQDTHRKPITLKNLSATLDKHPDPVPHSIDDKNSDLGLLTPKLTKDDEECLKTVKTGLLNLVSTANKIPIYEFHEEEDEVPLTLNRGGNSLLSIFGTSNRNKIQVENEAIEEKIEKCTCLNGDSAPTLSLMGIKTKVSADEYESVVEFHRDMEQVIKDIQEMDLLDFYYSTVKQVFPWFDPNAADVFDTSAQNIDSINETKIKCGAKCDSPNSKSRDKLSSQFTELLSRSFDSYYIGPDFTDVRLCMFCKVAGEGQPSKEGRLLYCGQNEWVHVNCALWSSEVFEEIDGSLQNVHSAVSRARLIRCSGCDKKGASVGCCARSCPYAYHFSCAIASNCIFLENKEVYCKTHASHRGNKGIHRDKDFLILRSIYVELDPKKKKDVLLNEVRLCIGSLSIYSVGEILTDLSDLTQYLLPCDYHCSRLFWSTKEPWKLVRYFIKTLVLTPPDDYRPENDTNFTVDHSLEFTPPPSPIESYECIGKDVNAVVSQLIDAVCSREEENNLSDHQNTDLLPPEIKDAIFEDLPHDLLDTILMHDIFPKMNFDDGFESKNDKMDYGAETSIQRKHDFVRRPQAKISKSWKRKSILQVDGAVGASDSDDSNHEEDQPVKCNRCRRTYRSNVGFERHLPTCSEYLSESETESSEDEKDAEIVYEYQVPQSNANYQPEIQYVCDQNQYVQPNITQPQVVEIQGALPQSQTIILQSMPQENYVQSFPSAQAQAPLQYIAAPQFHIQHPVVPQPTVLGTIIQSNGVEQLVLNNHNSGLELYTPPQNNVYIANPPMIVGMETVVSNTVMSSSQFISASVPGMLAASSYSATTTQVFHAAKPVEVPQSFVVVNNPVINPVQKVETIRSAAPWEDYTVKCQESFKINKNVSYQTVTRQIIHEQNDIDGVKMINSTQETIVIEPMPSKVNYVCPAKPSQVKIVELPNSSAVHKEKPQQAVAPVVVKQVPVAKEVAKVEKPPAPSSSSAVPPQRKPPVRPPPVLPPVKERIQPKPVEPKLHVRPPPKPRPRLLPKKTVVKETESDQPTITFEISSEDGFSFSTPNLKEAWEKVFEAVQKARAAKGLPLLETNPFQNPETMFKRLLGLGNNSVKYILEQLPGASGCLRYKPTYHKKRPSALEQELSRCPKANPTGCARTEAVKHNRIKYDMFGWLASRHRRPPKLVNPEFDLTSNRRATSSNLPMAMRFRHLKETSKLAVGVFRSDIHGRGLFCLRDIDSGEMVIEYAGEVIRSALTDKREKYYTAKGIGCYMFRIDDKSVVDATMKGNAARFINHSCEPNCYSKVVDILGKKHILIFALRKIIQGEELTYDYKFPLEEDKINCHCLSRRCRKYLN